MKIDSYKAFLIPRIIFVSIILCPFNIALLIYLIYFFKMASIVIFTCFLLFTFFVYLILFKTAKKYRSYLSFSDGFISFKPYPSTADKPYLVIPLSNILSFEYYKPCSIRIIIYLFSSLSLQSNCLYVNYLHGEKQIKLDIGFATKKEIEEFCKILNIDLII